jgi:hypothetical protein
MKRKVLVVDIGGTHVKLLMSLRNEREFPSGPRMGDWEVMKRDSSVHKPRNVCSARITIKTLLEALHRVGSFGRAFGARAATRGIIIAVETWGTPKWS